MELRKATLLDASAILEITHRAFVLYKNELNPNVPVVALSETIDDVKNDIEKHTIYIAEESNIILGSIRYCTLNSDLAYIYRFGVEPSLANSGVGTDLLNLVIDDCQSRQIKAISLHTNSKYYKLARYYYGKQFYVHSTNTAKGYIRALFIKDLVDNNENLDLTPAINK